jgi:hypothetical protein
MNESKRKETNMARAKYVVKNKHSGEAICGIRWDADEGEILVGGPKGTVEEADRVMKMLDMERFGSEIEEETKVDGSRFRTRYTIDGKVWKEFFNRLNQFYQVDKVKSFRRLMG